jgi:hypothetical protein
VSDVPSRVPTHALIGGVNETIGEFVGLCTEYRVHEAREQLCVHLQQELDQLTVLEESLVRYVAIRC